MTLRLESDPVAEAYAASRTGVVMHDRSDRGRFRLSGAKAREMLNGLVTNDIGSLAAGQGCYAAALTNKGKIVADMRVYAFETDVVTEVAPRARDAWREMLRKFVNPRLAPHRDESETLRQLELIGPRAAGTLATVLEIPVAVLEALTPFQHIAAGPGSFIARTPGLGVDAFQLYLAPDDATRIVSQLREAGVAEIERGVVDTLRIEAGWPEWGVDIDDTTIAQEANLEELGAISFTKGCYIGQETVARVHFRGHVNRHLRGLKFEEGVVPAGAELSDANGKVVGDVRSAAMSPRIGPIALGMVRREVEAGATLRAKWGENGASERNATVVALPFPA